MANPIKQFEIQPIFPLEIAGIDLSFTNSSLWMFLAVLASFLFFSLALDKKTLVPGRLQAFAELTYEFIANMIRENVGPKGRQYFPLIFTLFITILLGNVLGLIPYSFTFTSHIIVTGFLALMLFLLIIIMGFVNHGFGFLQLFVPPGISPLLYPLIIPIEIISFLTRPITLSVRLFANMMAGHIMLKVFAGLSAMMVGAGAFGVFGSLFPMLFNAIIIAFELLIAALQAYVFTILTCLYLKDTVEFEH